MKIYVVAETWLTWVPVKENINMFTNLYFSVKMRVAL